MNFNANESKKSKLNSKVDPQKICISVCLLGECFFFYWLRLANHYSINHELILLQSTGISSIELNAAKISLHGNF